MRSRVGTPQSISPRTHEHRGIAQQEHHPKQIVGNASRVVLDPEPFVLIQDAHHRAKIDYFESDGPTDKGQRVVLVARKDKVGPFKAVQHVYDGRWRPP